MIELRLYRVRERRFKVIWTAREGEKDRRSKGRKE